MFSACVCVRATQQKLFLCLCRMPTSLNLIRYLMQPWNLGPPGWHPWRPAGRPCLRTCQTVFSPLVPAPGPAWDSAVPTAAGSFAAGWVAVARERIQRQRRCLERFNRTASGTAPHLGGTQVIPSGPVLSHLHFSLTCLETTFSNALYSSTYSVELGRSPVTRQAPR